MNKQAKGIEALHAHGEQETQRSVSDGLMEAVRAVTAPEGGELPPAEASKPVAAKAPAAPSLMVSGSEAIAIAAEGVEADRVREYGLLAEIDAKLTEKEAEDERLDAVIETTQATLDKAHAAQVKLSSERAELVHQRDETVDRIVSLNQRMIDNETARLRRG